MLRGMAGRPIVLAMANPDPEITYEEATAARRDVVMATGRSDYPNQVNNVLGFPFIFRGALDVRASTINEEMKLAATRALATLTKEDVPESVTRAYGLERLRFGPDYLIPKPFDHRVLLWEASAVAEAAMKTGVARVPVDLEEYRDRLESRLGKSREVLRMVINQAKRKPRKVVFPEGTHEKVLRATQIVLDEGVARPVLLGDRKAIEAMARELEVDLRGVEVVDPATAPHLDDYVQELFLLRQRKGVTLQEARQLLKNPTAFGAMMVRRGDADALLAGVSQHYPDTLRPALSIIGTRDGVSRVSGMFLIILKERLYFLADTTVNIEPTAEQLAEIALMGAEVARRFHVAPRVAMISFSNFGSVRHPLVDKVKRAVEIVRHRTPDLLIDGEMQADTAVTPQLVEENFPFCRIKEGANVLIFPDLQSANAAYKLLQRLGGAEAIGPILMGMRKSVHVLQHGMTVRDIVNMTAIAAVDAQAREAASASPAVVESGEVQELAAPSR
jgi:malate dehydrogenase (oxaloacetate-decarboxylating)(NADP+)